MTWDAYHRRRNAVRDVATLADEHRDLTPLQLLDRVDPRREAFDDEQALLLDLQLAWFQRLSGECDRTDHERAGADVPAMVAVTAWANAAAAMPGVRRVLDEHVHDPALDKARAKERQLLAMAGSVSLAGADRLVASARERVAVDREAVATAERDCAGAGLMMRLRALIPA